MKETEGLDSVVPALTPDLGELCPCHQETLVKGGGTAFLLVTLRDSLFFYSKKLGSEFRNK